MSEWSGSCFSTPVQLKSCKYFLTYGSSVYKSKASREIFVECSPFNPAAAASEGLIVKMCMEM